MVGAEPGGEMDAMQLSIVAETVAQISSAMGEHLAQALGASTEGIASGVVGETGSFPPPPFTTYEAELEIAGEFPVAVQVDFDGVALSKLGAAEKPAAAPQPTAAAPPPQAARAAAAPGCGCRRAARAARPPTASRQACAIRDHAADRRYDRRPGTLEPRSRP